MSLIDWASQLYKKVSNTHACQFMDDLLKGKRESWAEEPGSNLKVF